MKRKLTDKQRDAVDNLVFYLFIGIWLSGNFLIVYNSILTLEKDTVGKIILLLLISIATSIVSFGILVLLTKVIYDLYDDTIKPILTIFFPEDTSDEKVEVIKKEALSESEKLRSQYLKELNKQDGLEK